MRRRKEPQHPWEKSYPADTQWAYAGAGQPVYKVLDDAAAKHPNRACLRFLGSEQSYAQVQAQATHLAGGLQRLGLKKGERVGLCLPNCPAFVVAYYAVLKAGGTVVNLNPLLTEEELAQQVADSGASMLVTTNLKRIYGKVRPLLGQGAVRHVVVDDFARALPPVSRWLFRAVRANHISWVRQGGGVHWLHKVATQGHHWPVEINADEDVALLQYTGGTTGTPKGAMLTHRNVLSNARQVQMWLGPVSPLGEKFMVVLPLFHVFAMTACLNLGIATASTLVLVPLFNVKKLVRLVTQEKPTLFPGVPSLFRAMADLPGVERFDLTSIRWCISGGAPLPHEVKKRFEGMTGCRMVEGYGLTEASPVALCNPRHTGGAAGAVGLPLPGTWVEVRSLHNVRKKAKPGQRGEIVIRGPQVMKGYWNRPDETARAMVEGWLRTGDVGHMDADGYVYLTDRLKDIIITNGYNVYPRVIEEAVHKHPAVAEVTAIAIPDAYKGEVAKVFASLKPGTQVSEAELLEFARKHLNPLERPAELEIRANLPKTLTGKLSKKELVAEEKRKREHKQA